MPLPIAVTVVTLVVHARLLDKQVGGNQSSVNSTHHDFRYVSCVGMMCYQFRNCLSAMDCLFYEDLTYLDLLKLLIALKCVGWSVNIAKL